MPGTFYYWSGYVESSAQIVFRGIIVVLDSVDKELELNVKLNGFKGSFSISIIEFITFFYFFKSFQSKAQKCSFLFTYKSNNYSSCDQVDLGYNWCSPEQVHNGQSLHCDPIGNY